MDLSGKSIGKYQIKQKLGQGGVAEVFLAFGTDFDKDVAIKIIRTEIFGSVQLEKILLRFRNEAEVLSKLSHPNIIDVIEFGEYDGKLYLVMPYLSGGVLKQGIEKKIDWRQAFKLLMPIANGIQYAHSKHIIHRDIKPSNILITDSGHCVLTDFGIAKIIAGEDASETLTGTGLGIGTPAYMAPEQWIGKTDEKSDQYSFGIVLFRLIAGTVPFSASTPAEVLLQQNTQPFPDPKIYIPELPAKVVEIILKLTAKDPNERYPDFAVVEGAMFDALYERSESQQDDGSDDDTNEDERPHHESKPDNNKSKFATIMKIFMIICFTVILLIILYNNAPFNVVSANEPPPVDHQPLSNTQQTSSNQGAKTTYSEQPTNFHVSESGENYINLSWNDTSNEDLYYLYQWIEIDQVWLLLFTVGPDTTELTVDGLSCGTHYSFELRSVLENMASDSASRTEVITLECSSPGTPKSLNGAKVGNITLYNNDFSEYDEGYTTIENMRAPTDVVFYESSTEPLATDGGTGIRVEDLGGNKVLNFAPFGNDPSNFSVVEMDFGDLKGYSKIIVGFNRNSNTNYRPQKITNCDTILSLYASFDNGPFDNQMIYCGDYYLETKGEFLFDELIIELNEAESIKLLFKYSNLNMPDVDSHISADTYFYIDDLVITAK